MQKNEPTQNAIVQQLTALLTKAQAHATFFEAVNDLPFEHLGIRPAGIPYSIWQLVEHLRIAQSDIMEFSINSNYQSPKWPDEYWPIDDAPADIRAWENAVAQLQKDLEAFINLISQPEADLYTPFEHGTGQNLLRQAMLIADHNSYHTGQIILIRRLLNNWNP